MLSSHALSKENTAPQSPVANSSKKLPQSAQQAQKLFRGLGQTEEGLLDYSERIALAFDSEDENNTDSEILSIDDSSPETSPTATLRKHFDDIDFEGAEKKAKKSSIENDIAIQNSQLIFTCITIVDLTLLAITAIQESNSKTSDEQLTSLCSQANTLINFAATITPNDNPFGSFQTTRPGTNSREAWLRNSMQNIATEFPSLMISDFFASEATALADSYRTRYASNKTTSLADTKEIPTRAEDGLEHKEALVELRERLDKLSQPLQHLAPIAAQEIHDEVRLETKTDTTNSEDVMETKKGGPKWQITAKRAHTFWQGNPALQFKDLKRSHDEDTNDINAPQRKSARVAIKS
jgi:hypothetical protein